MFSTFSSGHRKKSSSSSSSISPSATTPRFKRHQVARACDWCRLHRIKCDSSSPCQNCQNRGGRCTKRNGPKRAVATQTLPQALKEVERLQQKIHDLEHQVEHAGRDLIHLENDRSVSSGRNRRGWDGIETRTAHSAQTQWYGPASSFYFIGRMNAYLSAALQQPQDDHTLQPASPKPKHLAGEGFIAGGHGGAETYLDAIQEDFFLDMYWHSYHPTYQILDEAEFREHYKSLWVDSATTRGPSALVDIVLALCMQFGVAVTPDSRSDIDSSIKDASVAGRWYYRRSQTLLMTELETPSISTLQSQILGLHLDPPADLSRPQRELRRRIWWTLYTVEIKTCMKLGRPPSVSEATGTCQLPADDHELARQSLSNIAARGDKVTWFTYCRLVTTLVLAVQIVHSRYWDKCADLLAANMARSLYTDAASLEEAASFLTLQLSVITEWLETVPDAMKTKRKGAGEPFSTDGSQLDPERYAPSWLQRQRLLLELLYHNLVMNIYRSFISFPSPTSPSPKGVVQEHAVSCVKHATTITHLLYEILATIDFYKGWYEAYQWQWNATLSLIGFVLAYPTHPESAGARAALDMAITVFEVFGNHFAVAKRAADVTQRLVAKADILSCRLGMGSLPIEMDDILGLAINDADERPDGSPTMFQSTLPGAMGLAYDIDSFYSFEPLYAGSANMADAWSFSYH
ncbi:fungal-specific transcription factor domain protein [Aspergillus spinulosporus]